MNYNKIKLHCQEDHIAASYFILVANRLYEIFGELETVEACYGIIQLITDHSLIFPDGFIINDKKNTSFWIWRIDAAVIASVLYAGNETPLVLKAKSIASDSYEEAYQNMVKKMEDVGVKIV